MRALSATLLAAVAVLAVFVAVSVCVESLVGHPRQRMAVCISLLLLPGVVGLTMLKDANFVMRGLTIHKGGDQFIWQSNALVAALFLVLYSWRCRAPIIADGGRLLDAGTWVCVGGASMVLLSKACNSSFQPTANRLDHGPIAVRGPYALVRHPGYLGMMVTWFGLAFNDVSCIGAIAALYVLLCVRRIYREETLLLRESGDYARYASRVRYRLVPWAW